MQTNNIILSALIAIVLVLAVVIAVLVWLVHKRHQLLERRREVIERERRETEMLLKVREQGADDFPKFRDVESELEHPQLTIPFSDITTMNYTN